MKMLAKLIQERADLVKEAKGIFATADQDGRPLTDEEKARDDEINARLQAIAPDIERLERQQERERAMTAVSVHDIQEVHDRLEDDPKRGFRNLADFALAVRSHYSPGGGAVDDRLSYLSAAPTNYHETTGDEGRMVPPAFRQEIYEVVVGDDSLLPLTDSEPTESNSVEFLRDETTPWSASGVQANWRAEGSQMTPSKLVTEGASMKLADLYAFVAATEELLSDAPRLNDRLTRKSGQAIRWKVNQAIVEGDGVGKPLGYMKSGALVTQAKESGQAATTIVAKNVAKMYARVINPSQSRWFINQDAFAELATMTLGDKPIWLPPGDSFRDAPGGFLFGRPVGFLENCETLGTVGDIHLVNLMGYYSITKQGGLDFASSIHLWFDYNTQAFRWTFRMNGQPFLSAAVSPAKGTTTRSHFVVLATRS
jgi:HK97 family phage major capsid protein